MGTHALALRVLIESAIRYTKADGSIEVVLKKVQDGISLSAIDDGLGIRPEDQERVFDRFYRSYEAKGVVPDGTGLGLSMCDV